MNSWGEFTDLMWRLWSVDDGHVREIVNGMWFVLTVQILLALLHYISHRIIKEPSPPQWVWVQPTSWYSELGTQLAISWAMFVSGSMIRAGWSWAYLECQNRIGLGGVECDRVLNTVELLYLASFLAITGGVCTIRVMLPASWRPWSYLVPAALALALPVAFHVFV